MKVVLQGGNFAGEEKCYFLNAYIAIGYLARKKRALSFCKHMFIQVIPIYFFSLAVPSKMIIHFGIFVPYLLKTAPHISKNLSFYVCDTQEDDWAQKV